MDEITGQFVYVLKSVLGCLWHQPGGCSATTATAPGTLIIVKGFNNK